MEHTDVDGAPDASGTSGGPDSSGGRDRAFTEFAAGRWSHLVHAAVLLGCSFAEAEDLAQVTLLRCHLAWAKVERADSRDAYVSRILLNGFRASRRRSWWGERPTDHLPETNDLVTDDRTDEVGAVDAVERALGRLPAAQRETVVLRYWIHLTEAETAAALGVAPGTVKSRLSRALRALALDPDLDPDLDDRYPR